jgi:hypothetical protein
MLLTGNNQIINGLINKNTLEARFGPLANEIIE